MKKLAKMSNKAQKLTASDRSLQCKSYRKESYSYG